METKKYNSFEDDPWVSCSAEEARKQHALDNRLVRHRGWEDCETLIHGYAIEDSYTLESLRQLANARGEKLDWMWVHCRDSKLV